MMLSSKLLATALVATSMPLVASAAPLPAPNAVGQVQVDTAQVQMVQFRGDATARGGVSTGGGSVRGGMSTGGRSFSGPSGRSFSGSSGPRANFSGRNWSGQGRWAGNGRHHRGFGRGFAAGVVIGAPYYDYGYYDPDAYAYDDGYVAVEPGYSGGGDVAYCQQRFRSYDVRSGTYLGFDGLRHPCP